MLRVTEHRAAVSDGRRLARSASRLPEEHRLALLRERQRLEGERRRLQANLHLHRDLLDKVREQVQEERTYYRRVYQQNRWWIELALKWWEARRAA
ncbi:MAG: hypothetical protein ACK45F_04995 [bacterium]